MLSDSEQQVLREMERQLSAVDSGSWPSCRWPHSPQHRLGTLTAYSGALAWCLLAVVLAHVSNAAALGLLVATGVLGLLVALLREPIPPHIQVALGAVVGWVPVGDWSYGDCSYMAGDGPAPSAHVTEDVSQ